jgi:hypothetical protein
VDFRFRLEPVPVFQQTFSVAFEAKLSLEGSVPLTVCLDLINDTSPRDRTDCNG